VDVDNQKQAKTNRAMYLVSTDYQVVVEKSQNRLLPRSKVYRIFSNFVSRNQTKANSLHHGC
jgi:hypothetical protein